MSDDAATRLAVIASLLWPGVLSRPAQTSFHVAFGDLPTWLLAAFALGALIAALLAYRKQSASDRHLAEQVRLQGEALKDQQKANAVQVMVLERTQDALSRQQADQTRLERDQWFGDLAVLKADASGFHRATVINESGRPIRNVVCQLQSSADGRMRRAKKVGLLVPFPEVSNFGPGWQFEKEDEGSQIRLLYAGRGCGFVFPVRGARQAIMTLRFDDDAGQHWQVDNDLHLEQLNSRDW